MRTDLRSIFALKVYLLAFRVCKCLADVGGPQEHENDGGGHDYQNYLDNPGYAGIISRGRYGLDSIVNTGDEGYTDVDTDDGYDETINSSYV